MDPFVDIWDRITGNHNEIVIADLPVTEPAVAPHDDHARDGIASSHGHVVFD